MNFTEAYQDQCSTVGSAAKTGDTEILRNLIAQGCSVNIADNRGWFPLHEAAAKSQTECLQILIDHEDTEVDSETFQGETALYLAAVGGHDEGMEVLLKAGANPNLANYVDGTPLYEASNQGYERCVQVLLKYKANVNAVYFTGWTPLHAAAYSAGGSILKKLLKAGARIDATDDHRITPTFVAAQYGRAKSLKILTDAGGDVNSQALDGATALYIAVQEGHTECVRYLLESGANPNILTEEGSKPIHVAAEKSRLESLELLLPVTQLEYVPGANKWSPLHCTTETGSIEAAKLILDHGVDVNTGFTPSNTELPRDDIIMSPLFHAYNPINTKIFDFLLSRGADLRCEGNYSHACYVYTLFTNSSFYEGYDVNAMRKLVSSGLRIDCNCIPQHYFHLRVRKYSTLQLYKFLLDSGVKPKLNCFARCICTDNRVGRQYMQKGLFLAFCYAQIHNDLCPGSVNLLKCSSYWPHIWKFIEAPTPLQQLCRLAIREILRPKGLHHMQEFVSKMDITDIMKSYLLYEDGLTQMIMKKP